METRTDNAIYAETLSREDQMFAKRRKMRVRKKAISDMYRKLKKSQELEESAVRHAERLD